MRIQGRRSSWVLLAIGALLSATALAGPKSSPKEPEAVPGEFVVKLKPAIKVMGADFKTLSQKLGETVVRAIPADNIVVIKRATIENRAFSVNTLKMNPMVAIAEPNFIYHAFQAPNDPMYGNLWGIHNVAQADSENQVGTAGVDINAEKAWDITTGSKEVVVAVIDTGVDYTHPDLADNVWVNQAELNGQTGVDDDNNGYVDDVHGMNFSDSTKPVPNALDDHGHGSHCSGTIGAKGNDGKGIVGINWNVTIMPVKFLDASGGGTLDGAVMAVDYATKMGAKIMSNSWGGGGFSQNLMDAISRANDAGALFVAAAGNDGSSNDTTPAYPASFNVPNVVAVAAIDNQGHLASFSNYGKSVHIAAPGVNIYSSIIGATYDSWSGTSMATPHVSGVAALLLANDPTMTNLQLKDRLTSTARPLPGLRGKVSSGGMVDAYNALTNTVPPPDPNDPANWQSTAVAVSSAHPYDNNANNTFEVNVPGATEISVYFDKFETENNFDKVTFYDKAGNVIGTMTGANDGSFSPVIEGDYVKMVLTSDNSVTKYGFDVTKAAFR